MNKYGVDTLKILMKVTYLWLVYAIVVPGGCVAVAHLLNNGEPLRPATANQELVFWLFLGLAFVEGALAFYLRGYLQRRPLIRSEATFAEDFAGSFTTNFVIISALIEAIAIYGVVQFFAFGADVKVVMLFAILCVIAFQLARPREKFIADALKIQEEHVAAGRFAPPRG